MTSEKQRPLGGNRGASKYSQLAQASRPYKWRFDASSKLKLARAYLRAVDLPDAYRGPFRGWWGCLSS